MDFEVSYSSFVTSSSSDSGNEEITTQCLAARRGSYPMELEGVQLDYIREKIEILLEDTKLLGVLCSKAKDYEEFPALVYRLFYVHDQTHTLLRWALEKDINSLHPNELFRGETLATRLFYWQFFGDVGKRFLTSILSNLFQKFASLDHSVEIDTNRIVPSQTDVNENLKWIITQLNDFVMQLQDSADLCPVGLRESFLLLKDVASSKVEDSNSFVATVLFLRLICPCLVVPERYEILDGLGLTLTEHGKRGLVIASKILQSAANNFPWENRAGSELVNEFIAQSNPLIVNFASKLIDAEIISLGKKLIRASISPASASEVKQTHDALQQFIETFILNKEEQLKSEINYQHKYQLGMKYYQSFDWKICAVGDKEDCEYHVSQMKQPGSSVFVCRYWGRFKAKYEMVKDYAHLCFPELNLDDRVTSWRIIEQFDDHHCDLHMIGAAMFPLGARDFVLKRRNFDETTDRWVQIAYSIERDDTPVFKKYIRGQANLVFSVVERDPLDPDYTLYTCIFDMDMKGWVPAFFVNKANKDNLSFLENEAEAIMQLEGPIVPILKKEPESKKKKDVKGYVA